MEYDGRSPTADRDLIPFIDQDHALLDVMCRTLRDAGFGAAKASDARSGMGIAMAVRPTVVVLDLALPDVPGYEVCRRLRSDDLLAGTGLLVLSSRTELFDTLEHLEKKLRAWGYSVVTIHGGHSAMDRKERRQRFEGPEVQVCIATDAAGEGVNLQFCHLMINYDVPWNPNRLEQRMGRIHRIGQTRDVHVFNFVATNTEEGRVLRTLLDKIQKIKTDLKTDRIFDVIGTFLRTEGIRSA